MSRVGGRDLWKFLLLFKCGAIFQPFTTFDAGEKTAYKFISLKISIFTQDNSLLILDMMKEKCENSVR